MSQVSDLGNGAQAANEAAVVITTAASVDLIDLDDLELGKAAEHLVCADLILKGYRAFLADQGLPYDIIIEINSKAYRLQVKATRHPKDVPQRKSSIPAYIFHTKRAGKGGKRYYRPNEFDLLCLVAMDIKVFAYFKFEEVDKKTIQLRIPGSHKVRRTKLNMDQYPLKKVIDAIV